jgi:predicted HicB family RNase H-like nuclease
MKSKLLEYKGYCASINVSVEDGCLFGKVEFINDSIVFGADTVAELKETFEAEIDDYLEFCKEVGKNPDKTMTGSFNVRIGADLHKQAVMRAKTDDVTLNEVMKKAVEQYVNSAAEIHNHVSLNVHKHGASEATVTTQPFELSPSFEWKPSKDLQYGSH